MYIYAIINKLTNERYVGSAYSFGVRKERHLRNLKLGKHCNNHLQNAWKKYGQENFSFEIIETLGEVNRAYLFEREQYHIDLKSEYNICKIAKGFARFKHTPEWRTELSLRQKGRTLSKETKEKISQKAKGRIFSNETRQKISKANSKEGNANFGKSMSVEQKEKISIANTGKKRVNVKPQKLTIEQVQQIRNRLKNGEKQVSIHKDFPMISSTYIYKLKYNKVMY